MSRKLPERGRKHRKEPCTRIWGLGGGFGSGIRVRILTFSPASWTSRDVAGSWGQADCVSRETGEDQPQDPPLTALSGTSQPSPTPPHPSAPSGKVSDPTAPGPAPTPQAWVSGLRVIQGEGWALVPDGTSEPRAETTGVSART